MGLNRLWKMTESRAVVYSVLVSLVIWQLINPFVNPLTIAPRAKRYKVGKTHIRKEIGQYLDEKYGNNGSVAIGDIGLVGYLFKSTIYDLFGLTSYEYTLKYKKDKAAYIDWILAKKPDAIVICVRQKKNAMIAKYKEGRIIMKDPSFITKYRATALYKNPVLNYHYEIFEKINGNGPRAK